MITVKRLKSYTITGAFFVLILGTLSHFFYEWSGRNLIVGLFSPVNESIWEHMKLLFFPTLLYSLIAVPRLKSDYPCVTSAYLAGILIGTLMIPALYYTYTGILGHHIFVFDIAIFVLSVIIAFFAVYRLSQSCIRKHVSSLLYFAVGFLLVCFLFTASVLP